jgi:MinD-like ATPase involved in chromosome partitioning or flagellar assembly
MDEREDEQVPRYPEHSPWSAPPLRRTPEPGLDAPREAESPNPPPTPSGPAVAATRQGAPLGGIYHRVAAPVEPPSTVDPRFDDVVVIDADAPPEHQPYPEVDVGLQYAVPTADALTARRVVRPRDWVASTGVRAAAHRGTFGLVRLRPGRREVEEREDLTAVRRSFGGLRQVTVVNPKGGAGKTVATLMLGMTLGQARGGFVLAWDNNETQGTLGMRAQTDVHGWTVRDLLRDLHRFHGPGGRVGELAAYVRPQEGASFDVLASDEAATAGEMLTAAAFRDIREVVGRFYKLLLVDTGNNARAENWQAAIDATDQLVVTMSARNDSAETAARLLDHLEQTGRRELVRRAVAVVTLPPHRADVDIATIEDHFELRCRAVLRAPYDRHLDSGSPVDYTALSPESRRAWLRIAAAVADGL